MATKKEIKATIKKLENKLEIINDPKKIDAIIKQIEDLEEQIKSPIWKKIVKWVGIASVIGGLIYTILEIVLAVI